jgi:hypothetical protein
MTKEQMIEAMTQPRELVVPVSWLVAMVSTLGAVIATLASVLWSVVKERFAMQDGVIKQLQSDLGRISKGCGASACFWRDKQ